MEKTALFGTEKINRILWKLALPVMLAQLIQAFYSIADSFFVGRSGGAGLTVLSIVYPLQLLMTALAVGTGVGVNTIMAAKLGIGDRKKAEECAGVGTFLAIAIWFLFAAICWIIMPVYARLSTDSQEVRNNVVIYGRIVCTFSIGLFLESMWTKVLQATGDMKTPMVAQIVGAITNIILDPVLIFGLLGLPKLGIAGAAIATVTGQAVAALLVCKGGFRKSPAITVYPCHLRQIFHFGMPNILMQSAYTFYIFGLNLILATFSDAAVTALGLYYKWQTFFFIPLGAMQTCIVPVISFNFVAGNIERCKQTITSAIGFGLLLMSIGALCFNIFPIEMLQAFTSDSLVIKIGSIGFRFVGVGLIPMVVSLIFPVYFQAIGASMKSTLLTVVRTVVLFVPLGFLFSRFGLNWFWLTFPVTETITGAVGIILYSHFLKSFGRHNAEKRG